MKRLLFGVLFATIVVFSASVARAATHKEADIAFSKGLLHFGEGDFEKARPFFQNAVKNNRNKPDHLYFLALIEFQTKNYYKSESYFSTLLHNFPYYDRAHLDYGVVLLRNRNFDKSIREFEKAGKLAPQDPRPAYYTALAYLLDNDSETALEKFGEVRKEFPKSKESQTAGEWIEKIQKGEKAIPDPEKVFWGKLGVGNYFDSNVTLDPMHQDLSGFNNTQEDGYTAVDLNLKWLGYYDPKNKLYLSYTGYQSGYWNAYFDMNRFNYGSHQAKLEYQRRLRDNFQFRLPVFYTLTSLGASKYFQNGAIGTGFDYSWNKHWVTSTLAQFRVDEFFATTSSQFQNRDAFRVTANFDQFYFLKSIEKAYVKIGFTYDQNYADGNDWDYKIFKTSFAFSIPLFWKVNFLVLNNVDILRQFQNVDSVESALRDDYGANVTLIFARPFLVDYMDISLSYVWTLNESNLEKFTYTRHNIGGKLSWKF